MQISETGASGDTTEENKHTAPAPVAPRRPHSFTTHGITLVDDYAWLKDAQLAGSAARSATVLSADIRDYLEAENGYTESLLGHTAGLQKTLVAEMRGRIKEDDSSVPSPDGPYAYLRKFREGGQHEMFGRTPRDWRRDRDRAGWRRACRQSRLLQVRRRPAFARPQAGSLERRHQGFGIFLDPGAQLGRRLRPRRPRRGNRRQRGVERRQQGVLLRQARRQSSPVAGLASSPRLRAGRGCPDL